MKQQKLRHKSIPELQKLLLTPGNREHVASRMKKTSRSVERWANGETIPSPVEFERLRRIINGMQRAAERRQQMMQAE